MIDRGAGKTQVDMLYDLVVLKEAKPEMREKLIYSQFLCAKVSMRAGKIPHMFALAEDVV
jgi:hypothetical protein